MKLGLLLDEVEHLDGDATIHAVRPWTYDSAARVVTESGEQVAESDGLDYLLEVDLCVEVIEVWSSWRNGLVPDSAQRCEAVVHYATYDAYQPVGDEA